MSFAEGTWACRSVERSTRCWIHRQNCRTSPRNQSYLASIISAIDDRHCFPCSALDFETFDTTDNREVPGKVNLDAKVTDNLTRESTNRAGLELDCAWGKRPYCRLDLSTLDYNQNIESLAAGSCARKTAVRCAATAVSFGAIAADFDDEGTDDDDDDDEDDWSRFESPEHERQTS